jgi:methylglutaconyl-CoA hydratase
MSDFNTLELITDSRGFATLWLSREDKNNAFNAEMIRELISRWTGRPMRPALPAAARARQALQRRRRPGVDAAIGRTGLPTNLDDARELAELMYNLAKLKIPTLAVVQGAALAARWA